MALGSSVVCSIDPVIDRDLNVGIKLDNSVVGFVDHFRELDARREHHPVEAAVERIGACAGIVVRGAIRSPVRAA